MSDLDISIYKMNDMDILRDKINEIDTNLLNLFEERMSAVKEIGEYKMNHDLPVHNSEREKEVLESKVKMLKNTDILNETGEFFRALMTISRNYQHKIIDKKDIQDLSLMLQSFWLSSKQLNLKNPTVVYQGIPGSYSEEALMMFFDEDNTIKTNVNTFEEVFKTILNGDADYGIVPLENSTTGSVIDTYDLLVKYNCYIVGEQILKVDQNLLGLENAKIDEITDVYSHPQGFSQSAAFLKQHPKWNLIPYHNTAISAKYVKESANPTKAAIASKRACEKYGLTILKRNINHSPTNYTRFIIVAKNMHSPIDSNKISVMFSLPHKSGTLYNILAHFTYNNINMHKIESRPMPDKNWEYYFFIDFEGSLNDKIIRQTILNINNECLHFNFLGNYKSDMFTE